MPLTRLRLAALLAPALSLSLIATTQDQSTVEAEKAVRAVLQQYFAAYASRDAELVMSFWNVQSPDFRSHQRTVQQRLPAGGTVEIRNLYVSEIAWDIDTAIARVSLDIKTAGPQAAGPAAAFQPWDKTLRLASEGGSWAVWSELDPEEDAYALDIFQRRLADAESRQDHAGVSAALNAIGKIYRAGGDYARALEYYQKGIPAGEFASLANIAELYDDQRDHEQARSYYQKALATLPPKGREAERALALTGMANVYQAQGEYPRALNLYQAALASSESAGQKPQMAAALRGIGQIGFLEGRHADALAAYSRSLDVEEEIGSQANLPRLFLDIANVHLAEKRTQDALNFAGRAHESGARSGYVNEDWQAHYIAGQVRRSLAESYADKARTDATWAKSRAVEVDKALKEFSYAIEDIEAARLDVVGGAEQQQRFMEGRIQPYHEMIGLLAGKGEVADAWEFAERSKGRALLDLVQRGKIDLTKFMTPPEREQEQRLNARLASLNVDIFRERERDRPNDKRLAQLRADQAQARLDREAFRTNLYAAHPLADAERRVASTISLEQAATLIPDAEGALLEYVVTRDRTYLFVLTRPAGATSGQPAAAVYPIEITQQALADRVESYRQKIANGDLAFRAESRAMFDLLLGPAQSSLRGKTSLILVPDSSLWDLPFDALQSPAERFVIEDQAVSYAPSLTVLMSESPKTPASRASETLLAFGNPTVGSKTAQRAKTVFMGESLDPLPEAERQVNRLRELYGAKSRVYVGAEASEGRAKAEASGYQILQFATHGILNSASPLYSHLVLSQKSAGVDSADRDNDGLLEAWEVMNLKLNADVVVLAACETARGRVGAGEGTIGMSWAFLVAGARTTVASQWKVESKSTTDLMVEFHRNLLARNQATSAPMSKARALQLAALKLLNGAEQYRHPFYWAGFVLIGDGR